MSLVEMLASVCRLTQQLSDTVSYTGKLVCRHFGKVFAQEGHGTGRERPLLEFAPQDRVVERVARDMRGKMHMKMRDTSPKDVHIHQLSAGRLLQRRCTARENRAEVVDSSPSSSCTCRMCRNGSRYEKPGVGSPGPMLVVSRQRESRQTSTLPKPASTAGTSQSAHLSGMKSDPSDALQVISWHCTPFELEYEVKKASCRALVVHTPKAGHFTTSRRRDRTGHTRRRS